jgi:hypothetical protein
MRNLLITHLMAHERIPNDCDFDVFEADGWPKILAFHSHKHTHTHTERETTHRDAHTHNIVFHNIVFLFKETLRHTRRRMTNT